MFVYSYIYIHPHTCPSYVGSPVSVRLSVSCGAQADLRVYVLVTKVVPVLEAFIFREGLVRICGEPYDISDEASGISPPAIALDVSSYL